MSGSVRSQEPADVSNQNVTLIRVIRCSREYFGLCRLNGKNYLFSSLGILFVWASSAQASSHKSSGEESWWFFSATTTGRIYCLRNVQIQSKVFWTNVEQPVSSAAGLGCRHCPWHVLPSARQQVQSHPRQQEIWGNEIPDALHFTLGMTKACLAAATWTPVWISRVGKMVVPFQRKEGAAAVRDLLPERSWEKGESISTQLPTLPGRVLGAPATTSAACNSLFSFEDFFPPHSTIP